MKKLLAFLAIKKVLVLAFAFSYMFSTSASALQYSPRFGAALAGVMETKALQRGFIPADPRFTAALSAGGAALTAVVTGGAAVAGAPIWVTVGLGALAAGAVALATDAIVEWYYNEDGTVTYAVGTQGNYGQLVAGQAFWSSCSQYWYAQCHNAATPGAVAQAIWLEMTWGSGSYQNWGPPFSQCDMITENGVTVGAVCYDPGNKNNTLQNIYLHQNSPYNCDSGFSYSGGSCKTLTAPNATPGVITKTPAEAADDLTPEQLAAPVKPQLIADVVNQMWQQAAAQPGYQGLPYVYSDPVTAADVEAWRSANPSSYPTVGDAVSPAVNPATGTVTLPQPGAGTSPAPGTQPGIPTAPEGSPQLDLGLDPGIGSPNLEATPTGAQILEPLTRLFPDLRNFQVPAHQAECPRPVFDLAVIGQQVQMDAHCTISEDVRGPLYNASLLAWVLAALFIVLSA